MLFEECNLLDASNVEFIEAVNVSSQDDLLVIFNTLVSAVVHVRVSVLKGRPAGY